MGVSPGDGLARCAVVFLPGAPPREGRLAFWRPDGAPLPEAGGAGDAAELPLVPDQLTVARRHGAGARARTVPALLLPVSDALPAAAPAPGTTRPRTPPPPAGAPPPCTRCTSPRAAGCCPG